MKTRAKQVCLLVLTSAVAGGAVYWQLSGTPAAKPALIIDPPPRKFGKDLAIRPFDPNRDLPEQGCDIFSGCRPPAVVRQPEGPKGGDVFPPEPERPKPIAVRPPDPTTPIRDPQPVLPAALPLQYVGFARDDADAMVAFLETTAGAGVPAGHYNLREADFFLGRYRINKVAADSIEVEDLDRSEKRTISIRR